MCSLVSSTLVDILLIRCTNWDQVLTTTNWGEKIASVELSSGKIGKGKSWVILDPAFREPLLYKWMGDQTWKDLCAALCYRNPILQESHVSENRQSAKCIIIK